MDSWLDEIVNCPLCGNKVREGDRIWLNGECLCPSCYQMRRNQLDDAYARGYIAGKWSEE